MRHLHFQHHDRDQDGDDTVAERFQPGLAHGARKLDRPRRTGNARFGALLWCTLALSCCKSPPNAPEPREIVRDNPDNMVEQPLAQQPPPALPPLDTSCESDNDCTPGPTCCPIPCNAEVINVKDVQQAQDRLTCPRAQPCPSAGGCRTFQYLCVQKKCGLFFEGDAGYRKR